MDKAIVRDVMTRDVITVRPETPYRDIIDIIIGRDVSAVPVVDDHGTLLGVVSEADLLRKEEHADDRDDHALSAFTLPRTRAQWRKAAGATARELMSSPVLTVDATGSLPSAARELAKSHVHRLFVVEDGKLVGVLARRDLLRAYLRDDAEIRADIEEEIFARTLHANPAMVRATVDRGVVTLTGRLEYQDDVDIAGHLVRSVPGVVTVENRLTYVWTGGTSRIEGDTPRPSDRDDLSVG